MRKIPVFVSSPTELNSEQDKKRSIIIDLINSMQMEARALGRSDYPKDFPLKEVFVIAKHCCGGVILGFEQLYIETGVKKKGTTSEREISKGDKGISVPTAWNNLEAGILFSLHLPLLIFKEEGIEGGVFDVGVTDVYVHTIPPANPSDEQLDKLKQIFLSWQSQVIKRYYEF